jgi:hypothetical protein
MTHLELRAWQRRCGFRTDEEAAEALRVHGSTFRRMRIGRAKIGRQTEALCDYVEISRPNWLNIAEAAMRIARLGAGPPRIG